MKNTKKFFAALAVAAVATMLPGCGWMWPDDEKPEEDQTHSKQHQLDGIWSYDPAGAGTRISFDDYLDGRYYGPYGGRFIHVGDDKWKDEKISLWERYLTRFDYKGDNRFDCARYVLSSNDNTTDATLELSEDGTSFTVNNGGELETWYRQSPEPAKMGRISFWASSDIGRIDIDIYDAGFNRDRQPDSYGMYDGMTWSEYQDKHYIFGGRMYNHFPSGTPGCGQTGTTSFVVIQGTPYKYVAGGGRSGSFTVYGDCMLMKLE